MLSEATIRMNFQKAKQQAAELEQIAQDLTNLSSKEFGGVMQNISSNWKGESATSYLAKGSRLQGDMTSTAKSLKNIAAEIRTIAQRIYDAEMENLRIATTRSY